MKKVEYLNIDGMVVNK